LRPSTWRRQGDPAPAREAHILCGGGIRVWPALAGHTQPPPHHPARDIRKDWRQALASPTPPRSPCPCGNRAEPMMDRTWRSASRSTAPSTRTRARPISTSTTPGGTQGALTDSAVGEGLTSWLQQTGTKAGVGCSTSVRTACRRQSLQQANDSDYGAEPPWKPAPLAPGFPSGSELSHLPSTDVAEPAR
jgi:hypothetical protein